MKPWCFACCNSAFESACIVPMEDVLVVCIQVFPLDFFIIHFLTEPLALCVCALEALELLLAVEIGRAQSGLLMRSTTAAALFFVAVLLTMCVDACAKAVQPL